MFGSTRTAGESGGTTGHYNGLIFASHVPERHQVAACQILPVTTNNSISPQRQYSDFIREIPR